MRLQNDEPSAVDGLLRAGQNFTLAAFDIYFDEQDRLLRYD